MNTTTGQSNVHSGEFVLKYCCSKEKQFHVAKFVLGKELDFTALPQPVNMHREGEENLARLPRKARLQQRGKEKPPWILSDEKKKTVLIGNLESEQNNNYFIFKYLPNSYTFQVIPIEEWYKFQSQVSGLQRVTLEEAEAQMVARKKREGSFEPKPQLSKIKKEEEERYGEENEPLDMNKFQTLDEDAKEREDETNPNAPTEVEVDEKQIEFDFDFDPVEERGDDDQDEDIELAQENEEIKEFQPSSDLTEAGQELKDVVQKLDAEAIDVSDEENTDDAEDESESQKESDAESVHQSSNSLPQPTDENINNEKIRQDKKRPRPEEPSGSEKRPKTEQPTQFDKELEQKIRKLLLVRKVTIKELLQHFKDDVQRAKDRFGEILKRLVVQVTEGGTKYIMLREELQK